MLKKRSTLTNCIVNAVAVIAFCLIVQSLISNGTIKRYYASVLNLVLIYVVAALGLNMTAGFLGQLPLGHAGFMAIGGYTAALISKNISLPAIGPIESADVTFFVATIIGGLVACMFGVVIGLPALRLHGDYLAIITLGFGEIIRVVIQNLSFTGGAMGLSGIPKRMSFTFGYIWVVITVFVIYTLVNSKQGRAIMAVREDEIAADFSGVNTTYFKIFAFAVAAFFAGVSGSLLAHHMGYLAPGNFDYNESIEILVMVVLGGLGSLVGTVISATVLTILPEVLQSFSEWRMIIYALLLVIVMIFKPSGLLGGYEFSLTRVLRKFIALFKKKDAKEAKND